MKTIILTITALSMALFTNSIMAQTMTMKNTPADFKAMKVCKVNSPKTCLSNGRKSLVKTQDIKAIPMNKASLSREAVDRKKAKDFKKNK